MAVKYQQSFLKTFSQLSVVSKNNFSVYGKIYTVPKKIILSPTFYRKYGCYLNCGGCCFYFSLDYIPSEIEELIRIYPYLETRLIENSVEVNGKKFSVYSIDHQAQERFEKQWCSFVDIETGGCKIHEFNPFSCRIELIKFVRVKDKGYIRKQNYGRAWNMITVTENKKILCDFADFDKSQFWGNDIPVLEQMLKWALYFEIENHLQTVIDALEISVKQKLFRAFEIHN